MNSQQGAGNRPIAELGSIGQPVSSEPGQCVLNEGEKAGNGIYILRLRRRTRLRGSREGTTVQLRELKRGFIGLSSTLSCEHCCYTVEATGAAEFTFVPANAAQELLRARPDLCLLVIQLLGNEMSSLCHERTLLNSETHTVCIET